MKKMNISSVINSFIIAFLALLLLLIIRHIKDLDAELKYLKENPAKEIQKIERLENRLTNIDDGINPKTNEEYPK